MTIGLSPFFHFGHLAKCDTPRHLYAWTAHGSPPLIGGLPGPQEGKKQMVRRWKALGKLLGVWSILKLSR